MTDDGHDKFENEDGNQTQLRSKKRKQQRRKLEESDFDKAEVEEKLSSANIRVAQTRTTTSTTKAANQIESNLSLMEQLEKQQISGKNAAKAPKTPNPKTY
jgi:hypothetical protein